MPRKGENIYKRKDGRWEARYRKETSVNGKNVYGYLYARTYREVKGKLYHILSKKQEPVENTADSELFSAIAVEWLEHVQLQVKESTGNKYERILNKYILPVYGQKKPECITYELIESECNRLLQYGGKKENGLSPKTVSDILSVLRSILKFAEKKNYKIVCDGKSIQIKQHNPKMRVFSIMEEKRLHQYLCKNITPCNIGIILCLFTGLRVGEVCALKWEDISFIEQTLHVHHTLQRISNREQTESGKKTKVVLTSPKSECSIRVIPLADDVEQLLLNYRTSASGYVLTNDTFKFIEPRTMQNHFKKALRECNIEEANFHTTRHTFATRCIELGFDVKSLSEILGHATVNITMNRYVHPTMELKKENMEKMSSLFAVR